VQRARGSVKHVGAQVDSAVTGSKCGGGPRRPNAARALCKESQK